MARALRSFVFTATLALGAHLAPSAHAQPHRSSEAPSAGAHALRASLSVARGSELLGSGDWREVVRGIERLGSTRTPEAIDALAAALSQGGAVRGDARSRLEAVRALAPHARLESVRDALLSIVTSPPATPVEVALEGQARAAAALALAAAGDKASVRALAKTAAGRGRAANAAQAALRARPPASLEGLLGSGNTLAAPIAALLGELGDVRAIGPLRAQLKRKDATLNAAAALALARLGDASVLEKARVWLTEPAGKQREPALDIVSELGAPELVPALTQLLANGKLTRAAALGYASRAPSAEMVPVLATLIAKGGEEALRALGVLGTIGGAAATRVLVAELGKSEHALASAHALGMAQGDEARAALERALATTPAGSARRLVLRAALERAWVKGETLDGLEAALEALLGAEDAADRALAAFGLTLLGRRSLEELVASSDDATALGSAAALLPRGEAGLESCRKVLAKAGDEGSTRAVACGSALLFDPADGSGVPSSRLTRWAEAGGALAPLAALALGARDVRSLRPRLEALLSGSDPLVRAHVALGLGRSPEADAVALLVEAYRFEPEAEVRRAVVRALSERGERQARHWLGLARDLDGDDTVRALARAALGGRRLSPVPAPQAVGPGTLLWLTLLPNGAAARDAAGARELRVVRSDGLALTAVSDPDGVVLLPLGSELGPVSVELAPVRAKASADPGAAREPSAPASPPSVAPAPEAAPPSVAPATAPASTPSAPAALVP